MIIDTPQKKSANIAEVVNKIWTRLKNTFALNDNWRAMLAGER